jgi:hypothetical protein
MDFGVRAVREHRSDDQQFFVVDWLGKVILKSGQQRFFAILRPSERRQSNRGNRPSLLGAASADRANQLVAVGARHANVADDHVGLHRFEQIECFSGTANG